MFIGFIAIEVTGDPVSAVLRDPEWNGSKYYWTVGRRRHQAQDCLLGDLAINGEVIRNKLIQDKDAGLRKIFSKIESGAYFNANERERLSIQEIKDHVQHRFLRTWRLCSISGRTVLSKKEEQPLYCMPREEEGSADVERFTCDGNKQT